MAAKNIYSVGQVNSYIRRMFSEDYLLRQIMVRGEVSNCKYHSSGHIYFTLKDASGTLSCVMFAGRRRGLSFPMKEGDQVVVAGSVEVYERSGSYQLYAERIIRDGVGLLNERYELLKKKLEEMGMFAEEYKQPLPKYIRRLGVVTAPTGAAVRDIINIARRRNPFVEIVLYPAIVQGDEARASIIRGIYMLDHMGDQDPERRVDVIIVGRGGGSLEDLWAFNEEDVAQAVFDCSTPIISAVGHETDTVITDYVADMRAPTPSAAAELAVFEFSKFSEQLQRAGLSLTMSMQRRIFADRQILQSAARQLRAMSPSSLLRERRMELSQLEERLGNDMERKILLYRQRTDMTQVLRMRMDASIRYWRHKSDLRRDLDDRMQFLLTNRKHQMALLAGRLESVSPLARLSGGYGFVTGPDGKPVTSVGGVREKDAVSVRIRDGRLEAEVTAVIPLPS